MSSYKFSFLVVMALLHSAVCRVRSSIDSNYSDISCADNATCIEQLTDELVKGVRANKTVKLFGLADIEPIAPVVPESGRSSEGSMARFFNSHAVMVNFGRYGVRVMKSAKKDASATVEIEYNGRSFAQEGRGKSKKVMQVILPLVLGFKAASTLIVAIAAVALLTFKAFLASKLALLVTGTMVVKKFLESFSGGMSAAQPNPYMYNQYPIDFATAGAHPGYTMGASAYAAPEMYGVSALGNHAHEMLQQPAALEQGPTHDVTGQYSQGVLDIQNPNITSKAGKRWDGLKRRPMYYGERDQSEVYSNYQEFEP